MSIICSPILQDTKDFLRKQDALGPISPETLLRSMDVTSLYTEIPHGETHGIHSTIRTTAEISNEQHVFLDLQGGGGGGGGGRGGGGGGGGRPTNNLRGGATYPLPPPPIIHPPFPSISM